MPTLTQRLAKLEERIGPTRGRLIVVSAYGAFGEDEAAAFLASEGIHVSHRDRVVRILTVYEREDGTDDDSLAPSPRLLSVSAL